MVDETIKRVAFDKLQKEIEELTERKTQIVKEINVPLLEANSKAKAIIKEANATAENIIAKAKKIRSDADVYSVETKDSATDMLHSSKSAVEEIEAAQCKLTDEKTDFESYKIAFENKAKNQKIESNEIMSKALTLKKEVDDLSINLNVRQATLDRLEKDVNASKSATEESQNILKAGQTELSEDIAQLKKDREKVEAQKLINQKLFDDSNSKFESTKRMELGNKEILEELAVEKSDLAESKNKLNKQFELLEKTNKDIEDKQLTLNDNKRLVEMKSRELDSKIATLNELRKGEK